MKAADAEAAAGLLGPEEGWLELPGSTRPRAGARFVPSTPEDERLCLRCYRRESDGMLIGKAWFGPGSEGPPGHAHGGSVLAVIDHALGAAAWEAGHPAFTARIEYDFRSMVPLGSVALVEAWVASVAERKVQVEGRLLSFEGHLYGQARGLFLEMRAEHLERFRARFAEPGAG